MRMSRIIFNYSSKELSLNLVIKGLLRSLIWGNGWERRKKKIINSQVVNLRVPLRLKISHYQKSDDYSWDINTHICYINILINIRI
jgi:hypothetical protein